VHFLEQDRLITEMNPNGFFVGEAGSAVLVASGSTAQQDGLRVLGAGLGREPATVTSDEPLRATGLIAAIGAALAGSGFALDDLHYRISDLNGEHYRFKEMVLAMLRYERKPKPKLFDLWHPIEFIGDVGAAIGPIVLGVALDASRKGYGIGPRVLCTFGNDDGERAALVVEHAV
jgi:3-oxoacyl-[acyl-carrier-protein] synthase-1